MTISRIDLLSSDSELSSTDSFDPDKLTDFEKMILNFRTEWAHLGHVVLDRVESADGMNQVAVRNARIFNTSQPKVELLEAIALQDAGIPIRIISNDEPGDTTGVKLIYEKGYIAGSGSVEQERERVAFSNDNPYFYLLNVAFCTFSDEEKSVYMKHFLSLLKDCEGEMADNFGSDPEWAIDKALVTRIIIDRASVITHFGGQGSESMAIEEKAPRKLTHMLEADITPFSLEALSGLAAEGASLNASRMGIGQPMKSTNERRASHLTDFDYNPFVE